MGGFCFFFFFFTLYAETQPGQITKANIQRRGQSHKLQAAAVGQPKGSPAVSHQGNSGSTGELREERILPLHPSNMENSKIDAALLKSKSLFSFRGRAGGFFKPSCKATRKKHESNYIYPKLLPATFRKSNFSSSILSLFPLHLFLNTNSTL